MIQLDMFAIFDLAPRFARHGWMLRHADATRVIVARGDDEAEIRASAVEDVLTHWEMYAR